MEILVATLIAILAPLVSWAVVDRKIKSEEKIFAQKRKDDQDASNTAISVKFSEISAKLENDLMTEARKSAHRVNEIKALKLVDYVVGLENEFKENLIAFLALATAFSYTDCPVDIVSMNKYRWRVWSVLYPRGNLSGQRNDLKVSDKNLEAMQGSKNRVIMAIECMYGNYLLGDREGCKKALGTYIGPMDTGGNGDIGVMNEITKVIEIFRLEITTLCGVEKSE